MKIKSKKKNSKLLPPKALKVNNPDLEFDDGKWEKEINDKIHELKQRVRDKDFRDKCDISDAMLKRRGQAILNLREKVIERYQNSDIFREEYKDRIGKLWFDVCMAMCPSYNLVQYRQHLLFAASIWILDQITSQKDWQTKLYPILLKDDNELWDLCTFEVWDTSYDYDLIVSVEYSLFYRNADLEETGDSIFERNRVLTTNLSALGKQHADVPRRRSYEALIRLIPEEAIQQAVEHFESLMWQWLDRYFLCIQPLCERLEITAEQTNRCAEEANIGREKLIEHTNAFQQEIKQKQKEKQKKFGPADSGDELEELKKYLALQSGVMHGRGNFGHDPSQKRRIYGDDPVKEMAYQIDEMTRLYNNYSKSFDRFTDANAKKSLYVYRNLVEGHLSPKDSEEEFGSEVADRSYALTVANPYEICFALLWLIDNDSDLPWLYGPSLGMMIEVAENLPWGIYEVNSLDMLDYHNEYGEEEEVQEEEEIPGRSDSGTAETEEGQEERAGKFVPWVNKKPEKPASMPDWFERKYQLHGRQEDLPNRNLAQIFFECTGCLMPRNLHRYDGRLKALRQAGLTGKDPVTFLSLMVALSSARQQMKANNFTESVMQYYRKELGLESENEEEEKENFDSSPESDLRRQLKRLQEENKHLRNSLHETERSSREIRKEMAAGKSKVEAEHRELADLRELLFNRESQGENEKTDAVEQGELPYEVRTESLVFGGEEEWVKEIAGMLSGKVKFIARGRSFDAALVRRAEIIWIQAEKMGNAQYRRILDAARLYKKPIRYFTSSSVEKSVQQLMEADS